VKHYTEADLLELYYLPPAEVIPIRVHLAECGPCALRYHGLQRKLQGAATIGCSGADEKPQSFWDRQRFSVMRKIQNRPKTARRLRPGVAIAAAVAVPLLIISTLGVSRWLTNDSLTPTVAPAVVAIESAPAGADVTAEILQDLRAVNDPWSSDELRPFREVVEWESWAADPEPDSGGES
jgi:hypothetical protein